MTDRRKTGEGGVKGWATRRRNGTDSPQKLLAENERLRAERNLLREMFNSAERELAEVREILAHTDKGSLPNDFTLRSMAEARIEDMLKLRDQVRDTCARAERAEAAVAAERERCARIAEAKDRLDLSCSCCDQIAAAIRGEP